MIKLLLALFLSLILITALVVICCAIAAEHNE